ncbi:MAG: response regulator [Granulosicoccaceae bacterium]|jgi:CheY-like chemotaxis protein
MQQILVIDDDESVRDAISLALEKEGYAIATAVDGEQGLSIAQDSRPDLVFLDIRMPGIDGVETMRRLCHIYPDLNIYIVTAFYDDYLKPLAELSEDGFDFEIVQKPVGADQLRQLASGALRGPGIA